MTSKLLTAVDNWIKKAQVSQKQYAIDRIKLRMVNRIVKKGLNKQSYDSYLSNTMESQYQSTQCGQNYMSIADFKPIIDNYSSIKILQNDCIIQEQKLQLQLNKNDKKKQFDFWMLHTTHEVRNFGSYPSSDYANKKIKSYHEQALQTIKKHSFTQFCTRNLKKRKSWLGKQKNPLQYKNTPISNSLTYLSQVHTAIALETFECLLKAAGDIQGEYHYLNYISQLMQWLIHRDDDIREQVYLQVIKQIDSKKLIYLKILCMLSTTIKISTRLYIPLLNYLNDQTISFENINTLNYYNYAFYHLIKNFDRCRKYLPTIFQLNCFGTLQKILITICQPRKKQFFIESYTTVQQFLSELVQEYGLDKKVQYLLYLNGMLFEKGILLDEYNKYIEIQHQQAWQYYKNFKGYKGVIVLKNLIEKDNSSKTFDLTYNYLTIQYKKGLLSVKDGEIFYIAACIIKSEVQDEQAYPFLSQNVIPKRKLGKISLDKQSLLLSKISQQYFKLNLTRIQARQQILKILGKSTGYLAHFFICQIFFSGQQQIPSWVGIQKKKIILFDNHEGRITRTIYYHQIQKWGKSSSQLCLKIPPLGDLHIQTKQVDVLTSVFTEYLSCNIQNLQHN